MKKIFTLASIALLSISTAFAQEAFKHLGASIEFGTTGLGINLSYPVISDHLVVTLGYNLPELPISSNFDLNISPINDKIGKANNMINRYNDALDKYPQYITGSRLENLTSLSECNVKIKDKINFGNFKAMVEYYPTDKSYFHITAGVFVGEGTWMNISAQADKDVWSVYQKAVELNKQIPDLRNKGIAAVQDIAPIEGLETAAKVNINGDTYHLSPNNGGRIDTKLTVRKIKPYVGVGFGSSVPTKKRLGFQMEIGAYYQGKPTFESNDMVSYDNSAYNNQTVDDIVDEIIYLRWYPQVSFRFTGRIF